MKNIFKTALASLLLMASCATDEDFIIPTSTPDTFYASIEAPETRTYADEDGKLLWTANDQITIFKGNTTPLTFQFTGETGQNYGGFNNITPESGDEFVTSNPLNANYAIYPSVANTTISNAGVINFTIPASQNYAENSFGLGANVMVAVTEDKSDNNLSFKNLGGYFEFSLYGDVTVKSIEFKGNNGEELAGAAAITATYNGTPTFVFTGNTSKTLTLDCGTGVELGTEANPTKFWFVVPAITYSNGITITITDTEDGVMEKSTSKSITIERSTLQPLNAFLVETIAPIPETWKIYYTATSKVTPYKTDVFGANIVSNEWNETTGEGVISFDGEVTSIGDFAFRGCTSLTSVTIPESVTSIGEWSFDGCSSLTSITIPNKVTSIVDRTFYGCSSLSNITIPNSVSSVGDSAFSGCSSLSNITIPDSVSSVGDYAFSGCRALSSITIPNSVISIGKYAFQGCESLKSIDLPDYITTIKNGTFEKSSLTSITIPQGVKSIGNSAFNACKDLVSVTISNSVTSIGSNAFYGCSSLININIPSSIATIAEHAFAGCTSLARVDISDLSAWCKIDFDTTSANPLCCGAGIYVNGEEITSLTIPSDIITLKFASFYGCKSLTSVMIGNNVTELANSLFGTCSNLENVTISEGITKINYNAFYRCSSLTSITIPDSVTEIAMYAFDDCSNLSSITIGSGVTSIGKYSLRCSKLQTVYCKAINPPTLDSYQVFYYNISDRKIYVPAESVEAYKAAYVWKDYADKIEGYNFK